MDRIRGYLPELSDTLALVGIALIGVGAWMLLPAAALIVVGALLLVAGLRLG